MRDSSRRVGLALALLVGLPLRPAASDTPPDPAERIALRERAEKLATDAKATKNAAGFVRCGEAYLDIYNRDPQSVDNDEVIYNAGVCFEEGRSIGSALLMFNLLAKYYPSSKLSARATARLAKVYGDIAFFDKAAEKYEEYAKKYAGEKEAFDAISDAVYFRKGIGDDDKAIEDTSYLIKTFGLSRPKEAAAAMFSLTSIYEKRGDDAVLKHLREYLVQFGPSGDADRLVIAHTKIGQALWRQSCPVKAVDGVCAKVTRERASALKPAKTKGGTLPMQCSSASKLVITTVPRDERKVRDAMASFTAAAFEFEKRQGKTGGDERSARYHYAQAELTEGDALLEAYLALGFPLGLDLDPAPQHRALRDRSVKRFADWTADKNKSGATATAKYESVFAIKDAASSIAAAARLGQLAQSFAATLAAAPIPPSVRTGNFAEAKVDAFCDKMTEIAEPLEKQAIEAFNVCLTKSVELSWIDESTRLCERELGQLEPAAHTTVVELHAAPMVIGLEVDLEPPETDSGAISRDQPRP